MFKILKFLGGGFKGYQEGHVKRSLKVKKQALLNEKCFKMVNPNCLLSLESTRNLETFDRIEFFLMIRSKDFPFLRKHVDLPNEIFFHSI
jgi:hypothetical protein